jgi:hypothetical protein
MPWLGFRVLVRVHSSLSQMGYLCGSLPLAGAGYGSVRHSLGSLRSPSAPLRFADRSLLGGAMQGSTGSQARPSSGGVLCAMQWADSTAAHALLPALCISACSSVSASPERSRFRTEGFLRLLIRFTRGDAEGHLVSCPGGRSSPSRTWSHISEPGRTLPSGCLKVTVQDGFPLRRRGLKLRMFAVLPVEALVCLMDGCLSN